MASARAADRCAQAMVHIKLAVQAGDGCPDIAEEKAVLRDVWLRLQAKRKAALGG